MGTMKTVSASAAFRPPASMLAKRSNAPILQKLSDVKVNLNVDAGYSVQKILDHTLHNSALFAARHCK
jgi:hypothetical protein